jgi:hypothetical protein
MSARQELFVKGDKFVNEVFSPRLECSDLGGVLRRIVNTRRQSYLNYNEEFSIPLLVIIGRKMERRSFRVFVESSGLRRYKAFEMITARTVRCPQGPFYFTHAYKSR